MTWHSGLALVGLALKRLTGFVKAVGTIPQRHGIATIDCIRSYVGLLCIGKSDFDAIENKPDDDFFKTALGLGKVRVLRPTPSDVPLSDRKRKSGTSTGTPACSAATSTATSPRPRHHQGRATNSPAE